MAYVVKDGDISPYALNLYGGTTADASVAAYGLAGAGRSAAADCRGDAMAAQQWWITGSVA